MVSHPKGFNCRREAMQMAKLASGWLVNRLTVDELEGVIREL